MITQIVGAPAFILHHKKKPVFARDIPRQRQAAFIL